MKPRPAFFSRINRCLNNLLGFGEQNIRSCSVLHMWSYLTLNGYDTGVPTCSPCSVTLRGYQPVEDAPKVGVGMCPSGGERSCGLVLTTDWSVNWFWELSLVSVWACFKEWGQRRIQKWFYNGLQQQPSITLQRAPQPQYVHVSPLLPCSLPHLITCGAWRGSQTSISSCNPVFSRTKGFPWINGTCQSAQQRDLLMAF